MRNPTKGGVWRNTEDEILKVAIMKYGLNQWARISSLLSRKTPGQCKARWYEWLDPSIKKTEWSNEEEELLLQMAKIFPSQWKTISLKVGRTAAQCLEHYNKLLDEVQKQLNGGNKDETEISAQVKSRFESDPNPETKPAKPDPIDMDEEEKESLSEAKARLSNTHGKKEKRKIREKSLEEAKRLALLQKHRELKAAGQHIKLKKKIDHNSFDLENEIAFFKKPQPGVYNVPEHELTNHQRDHEFIGRSISELDNQTYEVEQERLNKMEDIKKKKKEISDIPSLLARTSKANDIDQRIVRKSKMKIPLPQLTDDDLEEIAEYEKEHGSESLKQHVDSQRTKRTPMTQNNIMNEAKNLYYLSQAQTPFTSNKSGNATPSPISNINTPIATTRNGIPYLTPNPLLETISTPKNNTNKSYLNTPQQQQQHYDQDFDDRFQQQSNKNKLLSDLKSLPKPKNQIKISLPDQAPSLDDSDVSPMVLDNSEKHIREEHELKHKEQFKLRNRSTVLKLGLPRLLNLPRGNNSNSGDVISDLIESEIQSIIVNDNKLFPIHSQSQQQKQQKPYEVFSEIEIDNVQSLVQAEMSNLSNKQKDMVLDYITDQLDQIRLQKIPCSGLILDKEQMDAREITQSLQDEFKALHSRMSELSQKSVQLQKKLNIYNGGYQSRSNQISNQISETYQSLNEITVQLNCYEDLRSHELDSMESRIKSVQNDLYDQVQLESNLQQKYSRLLKEKNNLLKLQQ